MNAELSSDEINYAQELLKLQIPYINSFQSTLLQDKPLDLTEDAVKNKIQIIHCKSQHHWIAASTTQCTLGQVKVHDSVFTYCDKETEKFISNLFQWNTTKLLITVSRCRKQNGVVDCGLYAIAYSTAIGFGDNPSKLKFKQKALRSHLVNCFYLKEMSVFSCI